MQMSRVIAVSTNGAGFVKVNGLIMEVELADGILVIFMRNRLLRGRISAIKQQKKRNKRSRDIIGILRGL